MTRFSRSVPQGEHRERVSCLDCGHVFYENPKIVVGTVVGHGDRVLMCRRSIEPRRGFWTLPAGYLELDETPQEGAVREAREEACADIALDGVLAVYSVSRIGQVQIIYRGAFTDPDAPHFAVGEESLEVGLFRPEEIDPQAVAFPTVLWALGAYGRTRGRPLGAPEGNPAWDPRGDATLPGTSTDMPATDTPADRYLQSARD